MKSRNEPTRESRVMSMWLCNLPFQSGSPSGISESLQSARILGGLTTCRTTVNAIGAWGIVRNRYSKHVART